MIASCWFVFSEFQTCPYSMECGSSFVVFQVSACEVKHFKIKLWLFLVGLYLSKWSVFQDKSGAVRQVQGRAMPPIPLATKISYLCLLL